MEEKISRPISVWITQILLVIFILFLLFGLFVFFTTSLRVIASGNYAPMLGLIIGGIVLTAFTSVLVVAFIGLVKRSNYGRWLSVASLSLLVLFSFLGKFIPKDERAVQTYEYENKTQAVSGFITQLVIYGLLLWLVFILVKSDRVNSFFGGKQENRSDTSILLD